VGRCEPACLGARLARYLLRDYDERQGAIRGLRRERSDRLRSADVDGPRSAVPGNRTQGRGKAGRSRSLTKATGAEARRSDRPAYSPDAVRQGGPFGRLVYEPSPHLRLRPRIRVRHRRPVQVDVSRHNPPGLVNAGPTPRAQPVPRPLVARKLGRLLPLTAPGAGLFLQSRFSRFFSPKPGAGSSALALSKNRPCSRSRRLMSSPRDRLRLRDR
jgi:hypothetical protein